jgi:hypothetical protein
VKQGELVMAQTDVLKRLAESTPAYRVKPKPRLSKKS